MSAPCVYVLRLTQDRLDELQNSMDGPGLFSEPIQPFPGSGRARIVCIVLSRGSITYIADAHARRWAATQRRRLELDTLSILSLHEPLNIRRVIATVSARMRHRARARLVNGGPLTPRTLTAIVDAIIKLAPETRPKLAVLSRTRAARLRALSPAASFALAGQEEAMRTALDIAGLPRTALADFDITGQTPPESFLDGFPTKRALEDQMIYHDLMTLPGFENVRHLLGPALFFEGPTARMVVVLANKLPLERQTGCDLIYFNETYCSFVMVQYKALDHEDPDASDSLFRLPDPQLDIELQRMREILPNLLALPPSQEPASFRLNVNPFFLKFCPRIDLHPDSTDLVKGMYLQLEYFDALCRDPNSLLGPRAGKQVSYATVPRYFDNTEFVHLVSKAWVGTTQAQSHFLAALLNLRVNAGNAVMVAIAKPTYAKQPWRTRSGKSG